MIVFCPGSIAGYVEAETYDLTLWTRDLYTFLRDSEHPDYVFRDLRNFKEFFLDLSKVTPR